MRLGAALAELRSNFVVCLGKKEAWRGLRVPCIRRRGRRGEPAVRRQLDRELRGVALSKALVGRATHRRLVRSGAVRRPGGATAQLHGKEQRPATRLHARLSRMRATERSRLWRSRPCGSASVRLVWRSMPLGEPGHRGVTAPRQAHTWAAAIDPRAVVDIGSPGSGCGCSGQTGRCAVSSIQSF
jgi:hypothetical protein